MIAKLKGLVDHKGADGAVIDVNGVGYLVFCSGRTLSRLPGLGEATSLHIETHVREDHIHLYGFSEAAERDWFRLLTTVQGVGAKVALSVLSILSPDEVARAIAAQDKAAVARANGVGPKLAQRIVAELKDKAGGIALSAVGAPPPQSSGAVPSGAIEEAVSALVNLGYGRSDAFAVVAVAAREAGEDIGTQGLIRAALKAVAAAKDREG